MEEENGFEKIGTYTEYSPHVMKYNGFWIFPNHADQGPFPTCLFCAVAKGSEMDICRLFADAGLKCDIFICENALISDYCAQLRIMKNDIGGEKENKFDRLQMIKLVGDIVGLLATSPSLWKQEARIRLKGIERLCQLTFDQMSRKLKAGKPILAKIIVLPSDFCTLAIDEIYSCTPTFVDGELEKPHGYHAVLLIGCGDRVTDPLTFWNSHSWNIGHIMFKDILSSDEFNIEYPLDFLNYVHLTTNKPISKYHNQHNQCRPEADDQNRRQDRNNRRIASVVNMPCPCGAGICVIRTIKEGRNAGKKFYQCPQKRCPFFQSCDVPHVRTAALAQHQPGVTSTNINISKEKDPDQSAYGYSNKDVPVRRYSHFYRSPPRNGYGGRGRSPHRRGCGGQRGQNSGRLLVRNIPLSCRPVDLRVPFERFGPVRDVYLPKNYYSKEPRGFAFVEFVDPYDASEAQCQMNHQVFLGQKIAVVVAGEARIRPDDMRNRARVRGFSGEHEGRHSRYGRSRSRPVSYSPRYGGCPLSRLPRQSSESPAGSRKS